MSIEEIEGMSVAASQLHKHIGLGYGGQPAYKKENTSPTSVDGRILSYDEQTSALLKTAMKVAGPYQPGESYR
ncbi:MAG: hypothetical protein ACQESG_04425 [Nanobdellota archaeon]